MVNKVKYKRSPEGEANRLKSIPKGDKHWNWSNKPNLLTLHKRIHRKFGKAKDYVCECGSNAFDWAFVGKGEYTDVREDYKPLCRACHIKLDEPWKKKDPSCYIRNRNSKGQFSGN